MKAVRWITALCAVMVVLEASAAGAPRGIVRFSGAIYSPASASIVRTGRDIAAASVRRQQTSLRSAQHVLDSDVLAYFAGYASQGAQFVSVTYN